MTEAVSREEFRMLAELVHANERRLDAIDAGGTRGVAVLAVQIQELSKDMAAHEAAHDRDRDQRAANRKWLWIAAITLIGAVDGPIVTVLLAYHGAR